MVMALKAGIAGGGFDRNEVWSWGQSRGGGFGCWGAGRGVWLSRRCGCRVLLLMRGWALGSLGMGYWCCCLRRVGVSRGLLWELWWMYVRMRIVDRDCRTTVGVMSTQRNMEIKTCARQTK